jgi:hypothetical protein
LAKQRDACAQAGFQAAFQQICIANTSISEINEPDVAKMATEVTQAILNAEVEA